MAHELASAGHDVTIESWARQYPRRLYPGQLTLAQDEPEMEPFPSVRAKLAWNRPDSWAAAGRRARHADLLILPVASTIQIPALHAVARAAKGKPSTLALMHCVIPHEPKPWDRPLLRKFLRSAHRVLVHSEPESARARELTSAPVSVTDLPANFDAPPTQPPCRPSAQAPLHVLAFGIVRPYKGVDVLLRAAAQVPQVHVTVAGEFWSPESETRELVESLGIGDRTVIRAGYIGSSEVPDLFAAADVVALPYRSATGSGNLQLAFQYSRPLLVTRVGSFADDVGQGEFGIVAEPDSVDSLAEGLRKLTDPEVFNPMAGRVAAAAASSGASMWKDYVRVLEQMAAADRAAG
jgi:glycosyltransferase involved in cell wall biosynthesis